eukprot:CAMPEP_0201707172 /NCGR_PEP_ID=MMETSP0578-20130828/50904_1 /ASSEMBLY_ACC=CAM_ASM_000663 /TAXON_ID=267565 /ORGANISM="Skeletonema grethea, Strain CCMP 1804" /LENGTH=307 /DNA_ID=CAMNT_0048195729 /DNA_START=42 /DNA_END=965 /DNA_ORIENTATION=+
MTDVNPTSDQHQVVCDPIDFTFTTPDLILNIIRPLIDAQSLPALLSLSTISTNFLQIIRTSETFWKELCRQRWKEKWGFHRRWEDALKWYDVFNNDQGRSDTRVTFWRERYFEEEQDATRQSISLRELNSLTFDFRFWIGQPTVVNERIVVKSGLLQSASRDVRFWWKDDEENRVEEGSEEWFSYRGVLTGHPCREPGIEWFMNDSSIIQWGFRPNLWPKGEIRRTENWGWEIRNPNVVMRAIDPLPSLDGSNATNEGNDLINVDEGLWKDLIDSLENVPMRNAPEVNGYPVNAELPRSFLDHPFIE